MQDLPRQIEAAEGAARMTVEDGSDTDARNRETGKPAMVVSSGSHNSLHGRMSARGSSTEMLRLSIIGLLFLKKADAGAEL